MWNEIMQQEQIFSVFLDHQLKNCKVRQYLLTSRPALSQFWSLMIRRSTFLSYVKFADVLILKLCNCERASRVTIPSVGVQVVKFLSFCPFYTIRCRRVNPNVRLKIMKYFRLFHRKVHAKKSRVTFSTPFLYCLFHDDHDNFPCLFDELLCRQFVL